MKTKNLSVSIRVHLWPYDSFKLPWFSTALESCIMKLSSDCSGRKPTFLLLQIAARDVQGSNRQQNHGNRGTRGRTRRDRDRGCPTIGRWKSPPASHLHRQAGGRVAQGMRI